MDQCTKSYWGGQGDCFALMEPIAGVLLLDNDHTAITKAAIKTLAGLRTVVAPATLAAVKGVILNGAGGGGAEPSGGENEITVTNLGLSVESNVSTPMLTLWAKMTWNDYSNYFSMEGKTMKFGLFDMKKGIYGTNASNTNYTPFTGHFQLKKGLPPVGADKIKSYPFFIYFDDIEEWGGNIEIFRTDYTFMQAMNDVNPIGIDIKVLTPITQTTGLVVIQANLRNSTEPYAGLTTTSEWNVAAVNDAGVTLAVNSFANAAIGQYTLAILAGGADITGDVTIQAYKITNSVITHLSNPLVIQKYTA